MPSGRKHQSNPKRSAPIHAASLNRRSELSQQPALRNSSTLLDDLIADIEREQQTPAELPDASVTQVPSCTRSPTPVYIPDVLRASSFTDCWFAVEGQHDHLDLLRARMHEWYSAARVPDSAASGLKQYAADPFLLPSLVHSRGH